MSSHLSCNMFLLGMPKQSVRSRAVVRCSNSSAKLQMWKLTQCDMHKLHDQCPCLRPYGLHTFPERAQDQGVRQEWVKNIDREDFVPKVNSTVGFGQQHVSYFASSYLPLNFFLKCLVYGDTDICWPASKERMRRAPHC